MEMGAVKAVPVAGRGFTDLHGLVVDVEQGERLLEHLVDVDPNGLAISYHVVRFAGERVQLTLEP